jgi:hypothetical protein
MICISVVPESRQLAKVDIFNAANQADLVEVCLDHLIKEPEIPDLLEGAKKPILLSCRREIDGGHWGGSEDERTLMLRQAIIAGPEWIELEVDIANKIPRFGKTKRLISFTQMDRPLGNLEAVVERAVACKADAIKFTGPTPTLDGVAIAGDCHEEARFAGRGDGAWSTRADVLIAGPQVRFALDLCGTRKGDGIVRRAGDCRRARQRLSLA